MWSDLYLKYFNRSIKIQYIFFFIQQSIESKKIIWNHPAPQFLIVTFFSNLLQYNARITVNFFSQPHMILRILFYNDVWYKKQTSSVPRTWVTATLSENIDLWYDFYIWIERVFEKCDRDDSFHIRWISVYFLQEFF